MSTYSEVSVQELFPIFSSPNKSRFSDLFSEISEKDRNSYSPQIPDPEKDANNFKKYLIIPNRIINGLEKRTSIIIKGIPASFGCLNFYTLLCQFCKDIDFFYVPGYALTKWNYIYAFVNVRNRKSVLDIFEGLTIMRDKYQTFRGFDFSKIEIYFCKSQKVNCLIKKCQNETNPNNFLICK